MKTTPGRATRASLSPLRSEGGPQPLGASGSDSGAATRHARHPLHDSPVLLVEDWHQAGLRESRAVRALPTPTRDSVRRQTGLGSHVRHQVLATGCPAALSGLVLLVIGGFGCAGGEGSASTRAPPSALFLGATHGGTNFREGTGLSPPTSTAQHPSLSLRDGLGGLRKDLVCRGPSFWQSEFPPKPSSPRTESVVRHPNGIT